MDAVATHLEQDACYRCDRPPITFDGQDRALCARHATIFLTASRLSEDRAAPVEEGDQR